MFATFATVAATSALMLCGPYLVALLTVLAWPSRRPSEPETCDDWQAMTHAAQIATLRAALDAETARADAAECRADHLQETAHHDAADARTLAELAHTIACYVTPEPTARARWSAPVTVAPGVTVRADRGGCLRVDTYTGRGGRRRRTTGTARRYYTDPRGPARVTRHAPPRHTLGAPPMHHDTDTDNPRALAHVLRAIDAGPWLADLPEPLDCDDATEPPPSYLAACRAVVDGPADGDAAPVWAS